MKKKSQLYRCKFVKETPEYIVGKDIFNDKTYFITKSKETRKFKIGTDNTFYATVEIKGILIRKRVLNVVDYKKVVEENKKMFHKKTQDNKSSYRK